MIIIYIYEKLWSWFDLIIRLWNTQRCARRRCNKLWQQCRVVRNHLYRCHRREPPWWPEVPTESAAIVENRVATKTALLPKKVLVLVVQRVYVLQSHYLSWFPSFRLLHIFVRLAELHPLSICIRQMMELVMRLFHWMEKLFGFVYLMQICCRDIRDNRLLIYGECWITAKDWKTKLCNYPTKILFFFSRMPRSKKNIGKTVLIHLINKHL